MLFPNPDPRIEVQHRSGLDREPRWIPVRFWLCQLARATDPLGNVGVQVTITPLALIGGELKALDGATLRDRPEPGELG